MMCPSLVCHCRLQLLQRHEAWQQLEAAGRAVGARADSLNAELKASKEQAGIVAQQVCYVVHFGV